MTGNRSFKGHSGQLFCCVFQRTYVHIRKGSGSLTTQLKTDEKVDGARSGAQSIFNLDQQLTFSRTILLQAFPRHILESPELVYSFRTALKQCLIMLFGSCFTKILETLHTNIAAPACCESRLGNCVLIEIRRNVGGIRTMWKADLSLTLCLHKRMFG